MNIRLSAFVMIIAHTLPCFGAERGVIDGRYGANIYAIFFETVPCNNLHPGDSVGIGDGHPMEVLAMLRQLREYPVFAEYRTLLRERRDRFLLEGGGRTLRQIAEETLSDIPIEISEFLKKEGVLHSVTREFLDRFYTILLTFMEEDPLPLPTEINEFDDYYPLYLRSLTKDLAQRYEIQKQFSVDLINALHIFHEEVLNKILRNPNADLVQRALRSVDFAQLGITYESKVFVTDLQRTFFINYLREMINEEKLEARRMRDIAIERARHQQEAQNRAERDAVAREEEKRRQEQMMQRSHMLGTDTASRPPVKRHVDVKAMPDMKDALRLASMLY